jgi:hypothetical protein
VSFDRISGPCPGCMSPLGQWGCPNGCKFELALCLSCGHKYGVNVSVTGGLVQSGKCMECRDNRFRSFAFMERPTRCACQKHIMSTKWVPGAWVLELDENLQRHGWDRCPPDSEPWHLAPPGPAPMREPWPLGWVIAIGLAAMFALMALFR